MNQNHINRRCGRGTLALLLWVAGASHAGPIPPPPSPSPLAADGRIVYYDFETDNGPVVLDRTGHGFHGAVIGATWSPHGRMGGGAGDFDGVNDYINAGDAAVFDAPNLSVSMWFKTDRFATGGNPMMLVSKHGNECRWGGWLMVLRNSDDLLEWGPRLLNDTCIRLYSTSEIEPDMWIHVVGTYDGTTAHLYLNGAEEASEERVGLTSNTGYSLNIGRNVDLGGAHYFDGLIDEFILYDRALTPDEVRNLHHHGTTFQLKPFLMVR